uniref:vegetative cell wall protein gp1-like n=1 Tax=Lonchura striata TaxID=40157 RepID=UPI001293F57F|nr:vegetative cell wall protein gp1-like [Lonchura striata domestica]
MGPLCTTGLVDSKSIKWCRLQAPPPVHPSTAPVPLQSLPVHPSATPSSSQYPPVPLQSLPVHPSATPSSSQYPPVPLPVRPSIPQFIPVLPRPNLCPAPIVDHALFIDHAHFPLATPPPSSPPPFPVLAAALGRDQRSRNGEETAPGTGDTGRCLQSLLVSVPSCPSVPVPVPDWCHLRVGGLTVAAVLSVLGVLVLLSGKCKCQSKARSLSCPRVSPDVPDR